MCVLLVARKLACECHYDIMRAPLVCAGAIIICFRCPDTMGMQTSEARVRVMYMYYVLYMYIHNNDVILMYGDNAHAHVLCSNYIIK